MVAKQKPNSPTQKYNNKFRKTYLKVLHSNHTDQNIDQQWINELAKIMVAHDDKDFIDDINNKRKNRL